MTQHIDWRGADTLPDRREVLHLQGIPAGVEPSLRVVEIFEAAVDMYTEAAEPRALLADISREAFAEVFRGEGRNAPVTPIESVVARAGALALFVATVGARVTDRIRDLLAHNEPALAVMLDAVASAAADRLTRLLADRFDRAEDPASRSGQAPELTSGGDVRSGSRRLTPAGSIPAHHQLNRAPGLATLGYSPGYCGWHVSGQRALFAYVGADAIGVTLNESCLMHPLKSVSGVLAAGPADIHRFTPAWAFCADCRNRTCLTRMKQLPALECAE